MFTSARLKLTAWYLLIIMVISIAFSLGMYRILTSELDRFERVQRFRQQINFQEGMEFFPRRPLLDPQLINETKNRIRAILILVNLGILAASSAAAYFLAGRTLKPIKEMVEQQNRFITDASHELKTPITSLKSEIEVSLRDRKLTLPEAKKLLGSNLEEVNNLQYLTDNLIKLSKNQSINDRINFVPVSLKEVTEEAIKKVSRMAKNKTIAIHSEVKDAKFMADQQGLVEVFIILLDNAIKYSPRGKEVSLSSRKNDSTVEIEIKDEGAGIDEGDLPHLFDRFYRADESRTKKNTPGYGLGLSIAKQVIDKHGGTVRINSKPGKGTTFTIILPI